PRHLPSTPVPYTTLFRSCIGRQRIEPLFHVRQQLGLDLLEHGALWRAQDHLIVGIAVLRDEPSASAERVIALVKVALGIEIRARSEEHTSELQSRENLVC